MFVSLDERTTSIALDSLGVRDSMVLQETEKIEHTLSNDTAICFESFVTFMLNNPDINNRYSVFKNNHI
jgi:Mn-dependent DtxR family transcriptional regulator